MTHPLPQVVLTDPTVTSDFSGKATVEFKFRFQGKEKDTKKLRHYLQVMTEHKYHVTPFQMEPKSDGCALNIRYRGG